MFAPLLFAVDFMNFTYATNPCFGNVPVPAVMRKGEFDYTDRKMGADFFLTVDSVKRGSLKAGTRQAVVIIECDYPVGGVASAYLFDERKNVAVRLAEIARADWGGDWGCGPSCIHARFYKDRLYVQQCADSECTTTAHSVYALRNGKAVRLAAHPP